MERKYRELTHEEIGQLMHNGCTCRDWNLIGVAEEGFDPANYRNAMFAGRIRLGACSRASAGIYNANIVNCTLGDNVRIANIGSAMENYDIAEGVWIEDVGGVMCDGRGNFGNGVEVKAVNEGGGREIVIFNELSAQFAYMTAMYRQDGRFTDSLRKMAFAECEKIDRRRGYIGAGARLSGCGKLHNTNVGPCARIEGADVLNNGTVVSSKDSPAFVGAGVKAYDFIISRGARVDNGAILERCFVGENCRVDHYFAATDCLFFANSDLAGGEACSVFAGPFTVSHHRSSLLIAGYFSFFNAGSGSNQSNHLFKTGPVHQGIHERGCKFASNAYVMLPAREGAFSMVMGRHSSHHDTAAFPYSYLVEEEGKTFLIPGANLRSYGTGRDYAKWPARDGRTLRRDRINFEEYNPYIGQKLVEGIGICEALLAKEGSDIHTYNRIKIKNSLLKRGLALYRLALSALMGNILATGDEPAAVASLRWADLSGMFAPADEIEKLTVKIVAGELTTVEDIERQFARIYASYGNYAKAWALAALEARLGHRPSREEIANAILEGSEAASAIADMRRDDSARDDEKIMRTGYGIDDPADVQADFGNVRKGQRK